MPPNEELQQTRAHWNAASPRCPRCGSRLRSDVVLFGERAPAYDALWAAIRRARPTDALVVVGTEGSVLPVGDIVRAFRGRTLLNNLHESAWLRPERFTRVLMGRAAPVIGELVATLEEWRGSAAATNA